MQNDWRYYDHFRIRKQFDGNKKLSVKEYLDKIKAQHKNLIHSKFS